MKIARTFTIDYDLYKELRKKPNQSRIVESSIRRYLNADEDYDVSEISTRRLLAVLLQRPEISRSLELLLTEALHSSQ